MQDKIEDVVFYWFDRVAKRKHQYVQKMFSDHNMEVTPEQWVVSKVVQQYEGITQVELADKVNKDTASITRILDILQKKGLLERRPTAEDRRKFALHMTRKGNEMIESNLDFVISLRKQAVKGLSKNEIESLKAILKKIEENVS